MKNIKSDVCENEKRKYKIVRNFTILRGLKFTCELMLNGIYIFLFFGGVDPFINKFGQRALMKLSFQIILFLISSSMFKKAKTIEKNKFGDLVYSKFEKELIINNCLGYKSLKWTIKAVATMGISMGIVARQLNILYPIIYK